MLMRALLVHIAHEIAGAARIRHSLRPLFSGAGSYLQSSGASRRENAAAYSTAYSTVIARGGGRPSGVPSMIDSLEVKVFYPA